MDPALFRLLMLRLRGGLRLRLIQLTSLRGLLFFLAFGGIIWLLVVTNRSAPDMGFLTAAALDRQASSTQISTFMPLGMLGMSLLTVALATGPTFHFSPTEINFLFAGPFRRRDLIIYKFCAYVAGATLSSALITAFAQAQTPSDGFKFPPYRSVPGSAYESRRSARSALESDRQSRLLGCERAVRAEMAIPIFRSLSIFDWIGTYCSRPSSISSRKPILV